MATTEVFVKKYNEFCDDLLETYSEKASEIRLAKSLSDEEKVRRFREEVVPVAGAPGRNTKINPSLVLPGVKIEDADWLTFSEKTQKAIQEYISLLSFCCLLSNGLPTGTDGPSSAWINEMMNQWKEKMGSMDFASLSSKIMNLFGSGGGFKLPEGMLKGQLAKLAEELVREFKAEDFGLDEAALGAADTDPSKSFELLMKVYTEKPELLQNAMKRIAKRLQDKVQRGELKPQELAAEAEEMMQQFSENPAFVELMSGFKNAFGFQDPDTARSVGRDGENRLSIARNRLRAKLEARKKARTGK